MLGTLKREEKLSFVKNSYFKHLWKFEKVINSIRELPELLMEKTHNKQYIEIKNLLCADYLSDAVLYYRRVAISKIEEFLGLMEIRYF